LLVSIYVASIRVAGGVSVSEISEKVFSPLASRVGFLFLGTDFFGSEMGGANPEQRSEQSADETN